MTEIFRTVATTEDQVIVQVGENCVKLLGKDPDGNVSKIYASEEDAIALANAILKHFGLSSL